MKYFNFDKNFLHSVIEESLKNGGEYADIFFEDMGCECSWLLTSFLRKSCFCTVPTKSTRFIINPKKGDFNAKERNLPLDKKIICGIFIS